MSISGCAHVISIHAFHLELSCLCLPDISTTSSGMPVHNTEASDASSFRTFLTGYGPRTYLTCRFENEMSNSTLREVNHIAKFNGTNFSLWKFGTWLLLEQHNLVGIVMFKHIFQQMSKIFPFYFIQNEGNMLNVDDVEARMDWQRRDVLARNYLVSTIESQQQRSLINCRTANEMWTRLSAQHLRNAVENQHVLQQRFFEYQYQPDHDIMTHITEVETMAS